MAARPCPDAGQLVEGDAETVGELEGVWLALTGEVALLVGVWFGGSIVDWEPQAKRRSIKEQQKRENKKNFARAIGMAILREKRDGFIPGSTVDNYSTDRHFNKFFYRVYEKEGINFPGKREVWGTPAARGFAPCTPCTGYLVHLFGKSHCEERACLH